MRLLLLPGQEDRAAMDLEESDMTPTGFPTSRRGFLGLGAGGLVAAGIGLPARAARIATTARIVIIGAGAAGTALVNWLVERLECAQITIVDPRGQHLYQPGLTLVAAGLKPAGYTVSQTTD